MKSNGNYFDSIGSDTDGKIRGVIFLNDLDARSNSIFADWGVPVIRPASLECSQKIADILTNKRLPSFFAKPCIQDDMMVNYGQIGMAGGGYSISNP